MNTTLIFAELLVIGLEGSIWLSILFISVFGTEPFEKALPFFQSTSIPLLAIGVALIYVLGVILDRVADKAFRKLEKTIDKNILGELHVSISVMRYTLGTQNDYLNEQLEYTRTRLRIVRASTMNFILIGISLGFLLFMHFNELPAPLFWANMGMALGCCLLLAMASFLTLKSLKRAHLELIDKMYQHLNDLDEPEPRQRKAPKRKKRSGILGEN